MIESLPIASKFTNIIQFDLLNEIIIFILQVLTAFAYALIGSLLFCFFDIVKLRIILNLWPLPSAAQASMYLNVLFMPAQSYIFQMVANSIV